MPAIRHEVPIADRATVASMAVAAGGFPSHAHDTHQLVIASRGVLVMGIEGQAWVTPRSRGLWIPAGVEHSIDTLGHATMSALWFNAGSSPLDWAEPTAFALTGLVRSLIEHVAAGPSAPSRPHAEALLFELMEPAPAPVTIDAPMPDDDRARRVAEALRVDPADPRTLQEWGREVGASDRTLLRLFQAQTGLGFHEWRTRSRIVAALPLLADGLPVAVVARRVGYASAGSFGAAFHRTIGVTPSAFATRPT
jgi:AraC-like DNA-binding protein